MIMRIKRVATLAIGVLICVFLFTSVIFAQSTTTGKIEGYVRDQETGQPLSGAQVTVLGTRLGNITNEDGYYFVLNVPVGLKEVQCTFTGYQSVTQRNIRILAGHTATVNISLSTTVISLEAITVEAESEPPIVRDNTMTKQRQKAEEIAALPISDIGDLINMQAGVIGQSNGRISIRGGRVGEEAVYVDGVLVKNFVAEATMPPILSNTSLSQLMPQQTGHEPDNSPLDVGMNSVEEISIITGGFQAEYGHAKSGVVNIVTKEGGVKYSGQFRYRTDQIFPESMDFGYNELDGSVGGPIPMLPYTFFHASGEVQGRADYSPRDTRDEYGFREINQDVVDRINAVIGDTHERKAKLSEFESVFDQLSMPNKVRRTGGEGDFYSVNEKITSSPIPNFKFLQTYNRSRNQRFDYSYSNEFYWYGNTLSRSKVQNLMVGFDWQIFQDQKRSSNLIFRASWFKDNSRVGQPWEYFVENERDTFLGFGWDDVPMWGEVATDDLRGFLEKDPWFNEQIEDWGSVLDSLFVDNQVIYKYFDDDVDSVYDYNDANVDTEGLEGDLRQLASDLGVSSYGGTESQVNTGPWGISNSVFNSGGGAEGDFVNRYLEARISISEDEKYNVKVDWDTQLDRYNRIKAGVDLQYFDSFNYDGGYSYPPATLIDNSPILLSAYLQDRFDLGDFVVDLGVRMDYMDPKGDEATSLKNYPAEIARKHTRKITEFAPRLGVAFPVTDRTQVRFSFGHFYQAPSWRMLLRGDRLLNGEAILDMSRTVMFEAGFTAMLSDQITVDIVGYNKDVQGDFAYRKFIIPPGDLGTTVVTNMDYANTKGADFNFDYRITDWLTTKVNYSIQFARTTGTDPGSKENALISQKDPITQTLQYLPSFEDALGYDRTHTLHVQNYLTVPNNFRDGTWEGRVLENMNAAATFNFGTGTPYDLNYTGGRTTGGRSILALTNAARGAGYKSLDLRLSKNFPLANRKKIGVFLDINNLFYFRNFRTMYNPLILKGIDENIVNLENRRPNPVSAQINWLPITVDPEDTQNYWWLRQHDLDQSGVVDGDEWRIMQILNSVMGYAPDGSARWFRMGVEYTF